MSIFKSRICDHVESTQTRITDVYCASDMVITMGQQAMDMLNHVQPLLQIIQQLEVTTEWFAYNFHHNNNHSS